MKHKIFTVYDSKAEFYGQPFFAATRGIAIRMFTELANDGSSSVGKYPADFTLFEIGEYDDSDASFFHLPANENIGTGIQFVNPT